MMREQRYRRATLRKIDRGDAQAEVCCNRVVKTPHRTKPVPKIALFAGYDPLEYGFHR